MELISKLFGKDIAANKDKLASILGSSPELLERFEKAYAECSIDDCNAKTAAQASRDTTPEELQSICERIVKELLADTHVWSYRRTDRNTTLISRTGGNTLPDGEYISAEEVNAIPAEIRPELTGRLMKRDIGEVSYPALLEYYQMAQNARSDKEAKQMYYRFLQGLDTLDIDPVMYRMLSMNKNSMGYWLERIIHAVENDGFFRIPATTIVKVPLTLLQLSRLEYMTMGEDGIPKPAHSRATLDIVDAWAREAFKLDPSKKYFIKTGTFSSKFDFRNAKITEPNEVMEIGEYLLYIQHQAVQMASFDLETGRPPMVGVSTTNDWVVREFIEDEENCSTIYHGLPLHTEYRAFIDFDTHEVLGIHPYWDPDVMKDRFDNHADRNDRDMIHDAIAYRMQENILMTRYQMNKDLVMEHLQRIANSYCDLSGQWSVDIMQNGSTFWLIDMAAAQNSAFYEQTVPADKRIPAETNWMIPQIKTAAQPSEVTDEERSTRVWTS